MTIKLIYEPFRLWIDVENVRFTREYRLLTHPLGLDCHLGTIFWIEIIKLSIIHYVCVYVWIFSCPIVSPSSLNRMPFRSLYFNKCFSSTVTESELNVKFYYRKIIASVEWSKKSYIFLPTSRDKLQKVSIYMSAYLTFFTFLFWEDLYLFCQIWKKYKFWHILLALLETNKLKIKFS